MQLSTIIIFIAQSLVEFGDVLKQMADVKYSLDDNVKQNFLEPLHQLQMKDLKEVMVCDNDARLCHYYYPHYFHVLLFIPHSIIVKNCKDVVWTLIANVVDRLGVSVKIHNFQFVIIHVSIN